MIDYHDYISNFPETFGVYIMKDVSGNIIYIGKANKIKTRVAQYFNGQDKRQKIQFLRENIDSIEYIVTSSELEALLLENNLIKKNKPKYNTLLKDSHGYPYIEITMEEEYPRIVVSTFKKDNKSKYFGPYPNLKAVKNIVELLNKTYKIRTCAKVPKKACLYYQLGQCSAPCIRKISREEYLDNIKECLNILSGNIKESTAKYTNLMQEAAKELRFEEANNYKNIIESLKYISTSQRISTKDEINEDIIGFYKEKTTSIIVLFMVRNGNIVGKEHYIMENTEIDNEIQSFLKQYYSNVTFFPKRIAVQQDIEDIGLLEEYLKELSGKTIKITVPKRGNHKKLVDMAVQNAKILAFEENVKEENKIKRKTEGIKNLEAALHIKKINRIESFDISNTSGILNVASMVVYENEGFIPKSFRKFRLASEGPNDYACMQEVIRRRFTDKELLKTMPDLLLIDGGQGHVNAVKEVLFELDLMIPVAGMVKDDKHNTKDLIFAGKELGLKKTSPEFKLIVSIQDRTHNFAINYHKNLRNKKMFS